MTREEATRYFREEAALNQYRQILGHEPLQSGKTGTCPACKGGAGTPNTGIKDGRMKCFSCGTSGDVLDWIGALEGISDFNERLKRAADLFNIDISSYGDNNSVKRDAPKPPQKAEEPQADFTEYFRQCLAEPEPARAYLRGRGILDDVIERYKVGHDNKLKSAIIPVSKRFYISRSIEGKQFHNPAGAKIAISHSDYLYQDKPVFITEGIIDAMSIESAGGKAIAIHSTSNHRKLIEAVKSASKPPVLILALDSDEAGETAAQKLVEGLTEIGATYLQADVCGNYKDPNEALQSSPDSFTGAVERAIEQAYIMEERAKAEKEAERLKQLEKYKEENSTAGYISDFFKKVHEMSKRPAIPTGFPCLDKALDGGLFDGLYIMGAISSLGKTTFALQVADNAAAAGTDVLIFSLEMARFELAAKSISRQTFYHDDTSGKQLAKTTRGIMNGSLYKYYKSEEEMLIASAAAAYKKSAEHIYIIEGTGDIGTKEIREYVKKHIELTGNRPLIIIDYLQILKKNDPRATDKMNTDDAVSDLKRISRDYNVPVFAISSLNRDNYSAPINMAAFKESGAIEYSSDVLLGLQIKGSDQFKSGEGNKSHNYRETESKKKRDPREIELKILKNRNGKLVDAINYSFYAKFNTFEETDFF